VGVNNCEAGAGSQSYKNLNYKKTVLVLSSYLVLIVE